MKVLVVDDDFDVPTFIELTLGDGYSVEHVSEFQAALTAMLTCSHDVYLVDYNLNSNLGNGIDLIKAMARVNSYSPCILLTSDDHPEVNRYALESGASDLLYKHELNGSLLERAIKYSCQHKQTERDLFYMANHDNLTGLYSRGFLFESLDKALFDAEKNHQPLSLLVMDINQFKQVNDNFGHAAGDHLLAEFARRLKAVLGRHQIVSRLGGDEFVAVLEDTTPDQAQLIAQKILGVSRIPYEYREHVYKNSASVGIASYSAGTGPVTSDELFRMADAALYSAKHNGHGVQINDRIFRKKLDERAVLEKATVIALENGDFTQVFQPKINILDGSIEGVEALSRWRHDRFGQVPAGTFIRIIEKLNLASQFFDMSLNNICATRNEWAERNPDMCGVRIAINASPAVLMQHDFYEKFMSTLQHHHIPPELIEIELTEETFMPSKAQSHAIIRQLRDEGVTLAIDDFGSGYSSLNYLARLAVDSLKIDLEFIKGLPDDRSSVAITKAIVSLCKTLGLKSVAEGIETEEQLNFLKDCGCDTVQGFYLSHPLESNSFEQFFVSH